MNLESLLSSDIIYYGAIGLALVVIILLFTDDSSQKKLEARVSRTKSNNVSSANESLIKDKTLRKQVKQDNIPIISLFTKGDKNIIHKLRSRLENAGMEISAEKYIMISIALILAIIFVLNIIMGKGIVLSMLVGVALGLGLPHFVTSYKIKKRQKKFLLLFPDAIDLIVRGIRAGLPVSQSVQSVAAEISQPVGAVFSEMADKIALGVTLDKALEESAKKLGLTEFNFFMTSIILQRETGGNLGEILSNLSEVLRQRQMMRMKIKAMSSEAKASAMIIGALPFVVFTVLSISSPDYLDPLYNDSRGNMAMLIAIGMLGTGVAIMTKMTRFEI